MALLIVASRDTEADDGTDGVTVPEATLAAVVTAAVEPLLDDCVARATMR